MWVSNWKKNKYFEAEAKVREEEMENKLMIKQGL